MIYKGIEYNINTFTQSSILPSGYKGVCTNYKGEIKIVGKDNTIITSNLEEGLIDTIHEVIDNHIVEKT